MTILHGESINAASTFESSFRKKTFRLIRAAVYYICLVCDRSKKNCGKKRTTYGVWVKQ